MQTTPRRKLASKPRSAARASRLMLTQGPVQATRNPHQVAAPSLWAYAWVSPRRL